MIVLRDKVAIALTDCRYLGNSLPNYFMKEEPPSNTTYNYARTSLVVVLNSLYSVDFLIPLSMIRANSYSMYSPKASTIFLLMDICRNSQNGSTGIFSMSSLWKGEELDLLETI